MDTRYLDADQRELSALLFSFYHNPHPKGSRSALTDTIALHLAGDSQAVTDLINAVAKVSCPHNADEIGNLVSMTFRRPMIDRLLELSVFDRLTMSIDPVVLWAHAYQELKSHSPDVSFDHEYTETDEGSPRPGMHGRGITVLMVNGAIMAVLEREGLSDGPNLRQYLADTQDQFGWVYCDKKD